MSYRQRSARSLPSRARWLLNNLVADPRRLAAILHVELMPTLPQLIQLGVADRRYGRLVRLRHATEQLFHGVGINERREVRS